MNYRDLLVKYMAHVGEVEGVDFLGSSYFTQSKCLNKEEQQALLSLEKEAGEYLDRLHNKSVLIDSATLTGVWNNTRRGPDVYSVSVNVRR
jgi:hypothetical protein